MEKIKIEAFIDPTKLDQVEAARTFFLALGSIKATTKKKTIPAKEEPAKEEPAKEEPAKEEPAITIKDVRSLLSKKVENHRVSIKAKLDALGTPNVTNLDVEKYQEFMDYLNSLD